MLSIPGMKPAPDMIELIEPLIPALRRYARALMRDREAADDLVQDCLERAITRWRQRRGDAGTRAWMLTMLHNLAMNRMKSRKRRGVHLPLDENEAAALAQPPEQEGAMRRRDLMAALDRLPEDQRQLLLLVSLEGVSYAEAAAITGAPIGTVMSRLSRGRERLRQLLDGEAEADRPALRIVK
ncbi:RNA polymerase sigma factor [Phenylobacterium sp.]|uniref:RNA polymerase sigma factor n=1 Tax=Phenylobacterium sp. TaxID=1871053 RepID=UPI0035AF90E2